MWNGCTPHRGDQPTSALLNLLSLPGISSEALKCKTLCEMAQPLTAKFSLVQVCEHPAQAFTMAALLAATWRAQLHSDSGETHVTAQSPPAAAAALPYALPSLLEHPQWRPAADAAAHRLAAIVEHAAGSTMVQCEVLVGPWLLRKCLLGDRTAL